MSAGKSQAMGCRACDGSHREREPRPRLSCPIPSRPRTEDVCPGSRSHLPLSPVFYVDSDYVFCSIEKIRGSIWLEKF